jgi:hypothetical protein
MCQLLTHAESSSITEGIDPGTIHFLCDPSRPVKRLTRGSCLLGRVGDDTLDPYNRGSTTCYTRSLYIKLAWPVLPLIRDLLLHEQIYSLQFYLVNGTTFTRRGQLDLGGYRPTRICYH